MISYIRTNKSKLKNKTVLLRCDLNEPLNDRGKLEDDFRIQAIVPTIKFLQELNCKIVITAHLGRPEGKWNDKLSLAPVADRLAHYLGMKFVIVDKKLPDYPIPHLILHAGDIAREVVQRQLQSAPPRNIYILENIRFYKGEEENDRFFSRQLSELADVYINDAFAVSHRSQASVVGVTKYLESFAGLELEKEIKALDKIITNPKKPFVLMMGGIKMSGKSETLKALGKSADHILLGGGLANVILRAKGFEVGQSIIDEESVEAAKFIAKNYKDKLVLPDDVVVARGKKEFEQVRSVSVTQVTGRDVIYDIGPKTILKYSQILKKAKTIVWNGPMGLFEEKKFSTGTKALAHIVGAVSKGKCYGVVGGGETVDAVRGTHQTSHIDHVSTGGGAMLEFLAGKRLPGLVALDK